MVMINGLSPTVVQRNQKTRKGAFSKESDSDGIAQTTKLADAVSQSIRQLSESELESAHLQYDLPSGSSSRAMEEYMDVLNQSKKEELAKLIGVDLYI